MAQISTDYSQGGEDKKLSQDIRTLRDAHNLSEKILELESRTSDPTGLPTTSAKAYFWFRSDTNELKVYNNGATKAVTLV